MKFTFPEILFVVAQLVAYVLGIIIIIQILRIIFGGSWGVEDAILALLVLNITLTFGLVGYMLHNNIGLNDKLTSLNDKISSVNTKIESHLEWHKGKEKG